MPFVQSGAKVLLTGANRYFVVHTIKDLLEHGYTVVGTVCLESKGKELLKLFPMHNEKLSYAIVSNIVKAGAFDQVIKDGNFDGVAHTTSPVVVSNGMIEDYVKPTIEGMVGVLESIKSYGQTVKRVVITSSSAAISTSDSGIKHDETHWNEPVVKLVEEQTDKLPTSVLYFYSKIVAEKAIWKWWSENNEFVGWDIATINPTLMMGNPIHAITSRDQLSSTNAVLASVLSPHADLLERPWGIVHVQDVAAIHSALFERHGNIARRRAIVVGNNALSSFSGVPKGNPGVGTNPDTGSPSWDTSFARELLGREFVGTKEMLVETEGYYRKKGWSFFA